MSGELYHYGVKGMKWGVRKHKPNSNDDSNKHEKRKDNKGLSTKQKVAIGAAFTAAVIGGAYIYSKWSKDNKDMVIKASQYMQRITIENVKDSDKHMYVAVRNKDKKKYLKKFTSELRNRPGYKDGASLLVKNYKSDSPIKIANKKAASRIYEQLKNEDEAFNTFFGNMDYKSFNNGIPSYSKKLPDLIQKYADSLSKAGYSGMLDEYDKREGSFRAMSPIILDKSRITLDSVVKIK